MAKVKASVPPIRPPQLIEMIERIAKLKAEAQQLGHDALAYFLDMCLIEAWTLAGEPFEPQDV